MRYSAVLLAFAGLTLAAKKTPHHIPRGLSVERISHPSLVLRQSCLSFQEECDGGCMPTGGTCCNLGTGDYCSAGNSCVTGGCCPVGSSCNGSDDDDDDDFFDDDSEDSSGTLGCGDDEEECGTGCMPQGSVCCDELSRYCDSGETCDGMLCRSENTLCRRKGGRKFSGGGGGSDDIDEDDDGDGGDDCGDGDSSVSAIAASALLAGMAAALPLVL